MTTPNDDAATLRPGCGCARCRQAMPKRPGEFAIMVLCPTCGNKRCPHATAHWMACAGSNEPGQPGSDYGPEELRAAHLETAPPALDSDLMAAFDEMMSARFTFDASRCNHMGKAAIDCPHCLRHAKDEAIARAERAEAERDALARQLAAVKTRVLAERRELKETEIVDLNLECLISDVLDALATPGTAPARGEQRKDGDQ